MKRISIAVFCVVCLLCAPVIAGAQRLTAGYISKDLNYLPFFIGLKKGLYAKEGIQVDLVSIGRADIQLQALVAGELNFANINADNIAKKRKNRRSSPRVAAFAAHPAIGRSREISFAKSSFAKSSFAKPSPLRFRAAANKACRAWGRVDPSRRRPKGRHRAGSLSASKYTSGEMP